MVHFGVLAVVRTEWEAISKVFEIRQRDRSGGFLTYSQFSLPLPKGESIDVAAAWTGGMGNVLSAMRAAEFIKACDPQCLLLCGIAGGFQGEVELGDVVVAERCFYYELGKLLDRGLLPAPQMFEADVYLLDRARNMLSWPRRTSRRKPGARQTPPVVCFGDVASGEKVIASATYQQQLKARNRRLVAIEMEGHGVNLAAWRAPSRPRTLVIRGISDLADSKTKGARNPDLKQKWREYAAMSAALYVRDFLRDRPWSFLQPAQPQPGPGAPRSVPEIVSADASAELAPKATAQASFHRLASMLRATSTTCDDVVTAVREAFGGIASAVFRLGVRGKWEAVAAEGLSARALREADALVRQGCPPPVIADAEPNTGLCSNSQLLKAHRPQFGIGLWFPLVRHGMLLGLLAVFGDPDRLWENQDRDRGQEVAHGLGELLWRNEKVAGMPCAAVREQTREVERIIAEQDVRTEFLSIVALHNGEVVGYEALTRGPNHSSLSDVSRLFTQAQATSEARLVELDLLCLRTALRAVEEAGPLANGKLVCLNITPQAACLPDMSKLLGSAKAWLALRNVVLDVVEVPKSSAELLESLGDMRDMGVQVAFDDHQKIDGGVHLIRSLKPRFLKTPYTWAPDIGTQGVRKRVQKLMNIARRDGMTVIAEGVETSQQLCEFHRLGVRLVQGFGFGVPSRSPTPAALSEPSFLETLRGLVAK